MPRCKSIRFVRVAGHTDHLPGQCRFCFRPCFVRVPVGVKRCDACAVSLGMSSASRLVKVAFVRESDDVETLESMVSDADSAVVRAARTRLEEMGLGK